MDVVPLVSRGPAKMAPGDDAASAASKRRTPKVQPELELDACCADVVDLLQRYSQAIERHMKRALILQSDAEKDAEAKAEHVHAKLEQEFASGGPNKDSQLVADSITKYKHMLLMEQARWMRNHSTITETHRKMLQEEISIALSQIKQQSDTEREAMLSLVKAHMPALEADMYRAVEDATVEIGKAKEDWSQDVCKQVALDLRSAWRAQQRETLQQLARELQSQRDATTSALKRQSLDIERAGQEMGKAWADEIGEAKDAFQVVSNQYKTALLKLHETKLKDTQRHVCEQAEFFHREIQDALAVEEAEKASHAQQLRRMRLSMLKWRQDYLRDAREKAQHRIRLETASTAPARALSPTKIRLDLRAGEDFEGQSDAGKSSAEPQSPHSPQDGRGLLAVLSRIWEGLPTEEDQARSFLQRVEQCTPASDAVLAVYQDYLEEHGRLPTLLPRESVLNESRASSSR